MSIGYGVYANSVVPVNYPAPRPGGGCCIRSADGMHTLYSPGARACRKNPQLEGWAADTANRVGLSLWEYFKPMLPWFIISNLITAIVIWKIASLFCSGRMAWGTAKRGIKAGVSSVTGAVSSAGQAVKSKVRSKVGTKSKVS